MYWAWRLDWRADWLLIDLRIAVSYYLALKFTTCNFNFWDFRSACLAILALCALWLSIALARQGSDLDAYIWGNWSAFFTSWRFSCQFCFIILDLFLLWPHSSGSFNLIKIQSWGAFRFISTSLKDWGLSCWSCTSHSWPPWHQWDSLLKSLHQLPAQQGL